MARVVTKKVTRKAPKADAKIADIPVAVEAPEAPISKAAPIAAPAAPVKIVAPIEEQRQMKLEPPTRAIVSHDEEAGQAVAHTNSLPPGSAMNIAKLQAMAMPDLNQMARTMGIENFGTMRKHEVIFHILQ